MTVICPACQRHMEWQFCLHYWTCDHCGFRVSMIDAYRLHARNPQEAADLYYADLLVQGWSPYPLS